MKKFISLTAVALSGSLVLLSEVFVSPEPLPVPELSPEVLPELLPDVLLEPPPVTSSITSEPASAQIKAYYLFNILNIIKKYLFFMLIKAKFVIQQFPIIKTSGKQKIN